MGEVSSERWVGCGGVQLLLGSMEVKVCLSHFLFLSLSPPSVHMFSHLCFSLYFLIVSSLSKDMQFSSSLYI